MTGDLAPDDLWLARSGSDLVVTLLGSNDNATIQGWFSSTEQALSEIVTDGDGGWALDQNLTQLVQAMASFSAANSAFDPTLAGTQMPNDSTLQSTIAAAWHTRASA